MLRDFVPRLYQQTILGTAANKNTLVVLPTGMGKTALALLLAAVRLKQFPTGKILMLAPTKPLCEQHVLTFQKHMEIEAEKVVLFTGSVSPEKRAVLWKDAVVVISTPQGLENDTINDRIQLEEVSTLIIDEAHHATGEYAYVWITQQYNKRNPHGRILALTASPGSDMDKVKEVCQNLCIEKVEVRTEEDPDVRPYVQKIEMNFVKVEFPESYKKVQKLLQDCRTTKLLEMKELGFCKSIAMTKGELLQLQVELQKMISSNDRTFEMMRSISLLAEALKVEHAIELLETQGISQTSTYLEKIREEARSSKTKAVQNLVMDQNFNLAAKQALELARNSDDHPKLRKLQELLEGEMESRPDVKIILFTQFRDSAEQIEKLLTQLKIKNHIFVGQAKKNGLGFSQKQQKEILDRFRTGEFNVLIATSVAEEGLDIPKVDKVIFYEPVPSAIRAIQRRGRTGRLEKGEVTVLTTAGTRDEIYRWTAKRKEKKMHDNLKILKKEAVEMTKPETKTLSDFISSEQVVTIVADHREKENRVVKELIELGIQVRTAQLESADYVLSGAVGVEMKKVPDFVDSIIDGRLLEQARVLKSAFSKSVIIIEGEEDIYAQRRIHPNAIRGMIATLALDFHLPLISTKDAKDTAALLALMARREQDKGRDYSLHEKKPQTFRESQEFVVAAFPGVGLGMAKKLLEEFGTIRSLANATHKDFLKVDGAGEKTAERLVKLFEEKYEGKKN